MVYLYILNKNNEIQQIFAFFHTVIGIDFRTNENNFLSFIFYFAIFRHFFFSPPVVVLLNFSKLKAKRLKYFSSLWFVFLSFSLCAVFWVFLFLFRIWHDDYEWMEKYWKTPEIATNKFKVKKEKKKKNEIETKIIFPFFTQHHLSSSTHKNKQIQFQCSKILRYESKWWDNKRRQIWNANNIVCVAHQQQFQRTRTPFTAFSYS